MTQEPIIRRVTPEELPGLLKQLDVEKTTHLALIGPDRWLFSSAKEWPQELQGHNVFQLTDKLTEIPYELLQFDKLKSLIGWSVGIQDKQVRVITEHLGQLTSLNLGDNEIGDAGTRFIAMHLSQLRSLHLGSNRIGSAGAHAIARDLGHLTSLNLGGNMIFDADALLLAKHLGHLTILKLGGNGIGNAGAQAIAENLARLTSLDLWHNQINNVGAKIIAKHLSQLTYLDLADNRISEAGGLALAENLGQLRRLDLGGNWIGKVGAQAIAKQLGQLTSLSLRSNRVGDEGARAIAEHLSQLTSLDLRDNQISNAGVQAIVEYLDLLTSLNLSRNRIGNVGAQAIAENLVHLTLLDLGHNKIADAGVQAIAEHLDSLIVLDLSDNKNITSVAPLANLSLELLNLEKTGITDLSPLKPMILSGIPVYWSEFYIRAQGINVFACLLEHPSPEIVQQGPDAVLNYFREIEAQGTDRLFEAKLLIVGEGGAGKTSLLRRMFHPEMDLPAEEETTKGIDIYRHDFPIEGDRIFRLNAWDFGGQQIYHATHQFFLTKRSLYVLVDDTRNDAKSNHDEGFKFWLEVVETLSEQSPLLIFQNEKGGRSKKIDEPGIKGRFVNVKDFYRGNLEHSGSAEVLRKAVEHFAQQLPHIGEDVPAKWVVIREELEELAQARPYISLDDYFAVYSKHLEFYREKALHLSQYFHDLGVFLHFQSPPELRRTVFLQNKWVTDAVFRILDDEEVKVNRGRFTVIDCDRLWADEGYASKDVELRALMERFELAYRLPDMQSETWLVPQHLSPSKPPELGEWAKTGDLVLTFRYEFLPRGLVSRLMVRMHRFVKQPDLCWSRGAVFEHGNTEILVETGTRGNEIALRSRGPEQKALLNVIASDLDALNSSFRGLIDKVSKLVPCICKTCKSLKEPATFEQKELIDRKNRGKLTIECPKPPEYYDVNVIELLEGISLESLPEWACEPKAANEGFAIAVSFPGEHRPFVLEIVEHLAKEFGRERVFYDEWHEAFLLGSGGDLKLQECYKQAKLVIPFFSEHYTKPWCAMEWETIRGILLTRYKDDAVIPVHLDDTEIQGWSSVNFGIKLKGRSANEIASLILDSYRRRA